MICTSCAHENRDGAKFCEECATPLQATASVAEERKVVTVVFCDLVMFTQRSETLDPEDVRAFLLPYYDVLTAEITRHGGTIDKFLGDGVMAVFGAPAAHEDDPERAVRTALKVLERIPSLGLDLHARIGINTGEVVVAPDPLERGDAITGDAANTASRLQAVAPVDGVVVGELTYKATSHLFDYEVLDPVTVKGKGEPVPIYRPHATIARQSPELVPDVTPFVGRDFELESLVRLFDRSRTTPSTEFVTIVADPGIGKSRLVRELARHVEDLPELITWRQGRCLPYGEGISFWALGEIVKTHAGILETDDQQTLSSKLDQVLTEPDESLRSWMKDRIAPLVGLETSTQPPQQEEAFTAWRRFLEQIATARPTVLVVEDLHWADDALVQFLQHLAERTMGLPILVITTARPELEERHPTWLGRARRSTVLPLTALADRDMTALVEATLDDASPELIATVLERAGGSPLYAEQLAAMLKDQQMPIAGGALDESAIPPTVQALLAARIDQLPAALKSLLLDASVVGKTFWAGAVAALADGDRTEAETALAELARREFIRPAFPSSIEGESEFTFWHALVRDVAYGGLPRTSRALHHVEAARWIEATVPERIDDLADILAHHYATALDLWRAAGQQERVEELEPSAARFLTLAGERALGFDTPSALAHLERALSLIAEGHSGRADALARFGDVAFDAARYTEAAAALEAAIALFRARGDLPAAAHWMGPLWQALEVLGDPRATDLPAEALALLEPLPPSPETVLAVTRVGYWEFGRGEIDASVRSAERAMSLAEELGLPRPERALGLRGMARASLGDAGGLDDIREAIVLATQAGHGQDATWLAGLLPSPILLFEGPTAFLASEREAVEQAKIRGMISYQFLLEYNLLDGLVDHGEFDEALELADDLAVRVAVSGDALVRAAVQAAQVRVWTVRGQVAPVLDIVEGLESRFRGWTGAPDWIVDTLAAAGIARGVLGEVEASNAMLAEVEACPGARENANYAMYLPSMVRTALLIGHRDLAERLVHGYEPRYPYAEHALVAANAAIVEAEGESRAAADGYADAAARWERFGVIPEQAFALAGLGRCLVALGETDEGVARLRESRAIWERLKATPRIAEIDEALDAAGT